MYRALCHWFDPTKHYVWKYIQIEGTVYIDGYEKLKDGSASFWMRQEPDFFKLLDFNKKTAKDAKDLIDELKRNPNP